MPTVAELEAQVNEQWGNTQWDWTIGKCPEGWFYYCGTHTNREGRTRWAYKGYAPTLTAALQAMLRLPGPDKEPK